MRRHHHTGAYNAYAAEVAGRGFTVTPTKGKKAFLPRWMNQTPTDPIWLGRKLAKGGYPDCNLGIVCGRAVAIDIDVDDAAKAKLFKALAFEHLGATAFQRIGRAPRTLLLYRPAEGEVIASIKIGDCIDVLSGGRQFVAYGIHPDTKRPYNWIDSQHTPATASIDDLPVLTAASLLAFAKAICEILGGPLEGVPRPDVQTAASAARTRRRTLPGEACGGYDARIFRDPDGRVIDGREALLAKLTAAEFAKDKNISPDVLANRVWAAFIAEADLSRPKGSNPRTRWQFKDALAKATAICRRKPDLKPPRRSRRGHAASFLHAWRKPSFWTVAQRELHLTEIGRRITAPAALAVARVMIEAVDLATGFCTLPTAEIAKRAHCSTKTVKAARRALNGTGLWIAAGGVFVPCPIGELNRKQATEEKEQKSVTGTSKFPPCTILVVLLTLPVAFLACLPATVGRRPISPTCSARRFSTSPPNVIAAAYYLLK
jgi:hypothetical protein